MNNDPTATEVETVPLTDWKNAPKVSDLKQDLTDAKPVHEAQKAKISDWLDNLNVTGKAIVKVPEGNSKIVPRLIRKQAEWRYAALSEPFLSTNEIFSVKPVTWEDRKAAQQNGLLLNHQFNNGIDKVNFIDEYIRTAVDEGTVIVKTSWIFEEEEYEGTFPVVEFRENPEYLPMHQQMDEMYAADPSQYEDEVPDELKEAHELYKERGIPFEPVVTGSIKEKRMRTVVNKPFAEICNHRNVLIDPTCFGDIDKATFVIHSFESSLAQLKKEKRYKNLDKINISGNSILGDPDHSPNGDGHNFNFVDKNRQKFVVFEYWGYWDVHKNGKLMPIVATWVGDTMIRLEENIYPDKKLPFVVVQYLPVRKSVYGEPDGALLEDNQKIAGAVTRGMIDILGKSANGQTGFRKDMLDPTNKRRFEKGQDYEFNPNVDPRQGVFMHTYTEIPASAQLMLQLQNTEAESLTGVKTYANSGISGSALGDVAAGVRGALDAASKRELGILRRLSAGIVKIGRKFISMNAELLSEKEVVRITNDMFVKVRKDDLPGNFDLKLSISTAEEDNNKAEQLAFMLQTMGPNMDPEMVKMIMSDIARLRKMPDMAHKIETYQPQPDPLEQKKRELEIALLEGEIAEQQAKTAEINAKAQLTMAQINTEGAKASNLQSSTDLQNLDFVEQESGVKQERELQKAGEQARSNVQLKVIDAEQKREDRKSKLMTEILKIKAKEKATQ